MSGSPAWVLRPERPKGAKDEVKGPKGLQLEVGARRAPRLLVHIYKIILKASAEEKTNFPVEKRKLDVFSEVSNLLLAETVPKSVPNWICFSLTFN